LVYVIEAVENHRPHEVRGISGDAANRLSRSHRRAATELIAAQLLLAIAAA
jgi:hypothetical protein